MNRFKLSSTLLLIAILVSACVAPATPAESEAPAMTDAPAATEAAATEAMAKGTEYTVVEGA